MLLLLLTLVGLSAKEQARTVNVRLMTPKGNGMQVPVGKATKVNLKDSLL